MPLSSPLRLSIAIRRHPRVVRLLVGIAVMTVLFAMLLSAVEPPPPRVGSPAVLPETPAEATAPAA